ncbi:EndoU domain-containing protein [Pseudogracilibacillus sp. SO30301A]|uniref:EndoU domain-containing protein n=1 Tax=Pseudogracilibacillus sp. SO30301A TaxID=3098291 RepID=UPI00300DCB3B
MIKKIIKLYFISFTMLFIVGCNINDFIENVAETGQKELNSVTAMEDLKQTEYFRDGALEHILEGELNKKGQAVGFHYNQLPTKKGEVIEGTKTEVNEFGVYEAKVIVNDVEKASNKGKSTFFPDEWDTQQVVDAINEAYDNKVFILGNTYEGLTADGMVIRMYLDQDDKIISAFPIY